MHSHPTSPDSIVSPMTKTVMGCNDHCPQGLGKYLLWSFPCMHSFRSVASASRFQLGVQNCWRWSPAIIQFSSTISSYQMWNAILAYCILEPASIHARTIQSRHGWRSFGSDTFGFRLSSGIWNRAAILPPALSFHDDRKDPFRKFLRGSILESEELTKSMGSFCACAH